MTKKKGSASPKTGTVEVLGEVQKGTRATAHSTFRASSDGKGHVRISGYANKFERDSFGTRFDPKSCDLTRYRQNPVILFNHDPNQVVGDVDPDTLELRDDGIWVGDARISNADTPLTNYVRTLAEEGILRGLSIRFDIPDLTSVTPDPEHARTKLVRNWELQEISIVAIPSQASSTFSLSGVRSIEEARQAVLTARGAGVAKLANAAISEAAKLENGDREKVIEKLISQSGLTTAQLSDVLAGDLTPTPPPLIAALVDICGCEKAALEAADAEDVEHSKEKAEPSADQGGQRDLGVDGQMQECVSARIPALLKEGKSQEDAVAAAINECNAARGIEWKPDERSMERFLSVVDSSRQADQTNVPKETVPVSDTPNSDTQPMLQEMKAQTALLGSIDTKLGALAKALEGMPPAAGGTKSEPPKEGELGAVPKEGEAGAGATGGVGAAGGEGGEGKDPELTPLQEKRMLEMVDAHNRSIADKLKAHGIDLAL